MPFLHPSLQAKGKLLQKPRPIMGIGCRSVEARAIVSRSITSSARDGLRFSATITSYLGLDDLNVLKGWNALRFKYLHRALQDVSPAQSAGEKILNF